jgi:hypothetical protein
MATYGDRMRAEEAFKRGFYYGLGFWISGIFLNVAAAAVIFAILLGIGVIGSAIPERRQPQQLRPDSVQNRLPASAPARRR